jgi:hypothetical protein
MKHKTGVILLIIGGICMIISSAIGSIGIYEFLYDLVSTEIPSDFVPLLKGTIIVLRIIADTGGIAVIFGALLILFNQIRLGKFFIGLGLTFGLLALIIWIISKVIDITGVVTDPEIILYFERLREFFTYNTGLAFSGVTIAIIGRATIKKPKKPKKGKEEAELEEFNLEETLLKKEEGEEVVKSDNNLKEDSSSL